jgi:5'-3' exoribonuclease 1
MVGISGRALSKITSSFMVITSDNQKTNLGLSLKFDAKGLKVIDYSRKEGRHWEFSDRAVELIREYKVGDLQKQRSFLILQAFSGQVP